MGTPHRRMPPVWAVPAGLDTRTLVFMGRRSPESLAQGMLRRGVLSSPVRASPEYLEEGMIPYCESTAPLADAIPESPLVSHAPTDFPRILTLPRGLAIGVRPAVPGDEAALLAFYRALPFEDRLFLKDDVTTDAWAARFMRRIARGEVQSLVAEREGQVVAEATLARPTHGWSVHVAELRVAVARSCHRQGLGTALAGLLLEIAIDEGADKVVVEVVENQIGALQMFRQLGFQPEAVLRRHIKDVSGMRRDLLILAKDLSHAWTAMEALVADIPPDAHH